MTRNLKVLGLALMAIIAMAAIVASSASAQSGQGELTSDGPVTLVGTETGAKGSGANALTSFGSKTECFGSTYTGHKINSTPHALIPVPATEITITTHPNFKECRGFSPEEMNATVEMNGCDYAFTIGTTTPAGNTNGTYGITKEIICPVGKKIHIGIWSLGAAHEPGNRLCTIEIPAQNGLVGGHVTSTPVSHDLDIVGTFEKIKVERHGLCLLDGKGTTTTEGKTDIDITVTGRRADGGATGITVTDNG